MLALFKGQLVPQDRKGRQEFRDRPVQSGKLDLRGSKEFRDRLARLGQ